MIRFGPAGIPLSGKGRTLKDGLNEVHNLGLTALEAQMIRDNVGIAYPEEEEIGLTLKDLAFMGVEIIRDEEHIMDPNEPIEEEDEIVYMTSGIADSFGDLYSIGNLAKRLDIEMSLHTPYYVDLGSNNELTERCVNDIMYAASITNALGGDVVVTNLGIYNPNVDLDEADANIYDNIAGLMEWWKDQKFKPKLGIEITGQENTFGSLEQVLDICDNIDGLVPVVNWTNHYCRRFRERSKLWGISDAEGDENDFEEDFQYVIDQVKGPSGGRIHSVFSGVEHHEWKNVRLSPIKKGALKFETLAECLVESKPNITIISSSPLLEHDAVYMRTIHERILLRKVGKMLRQKKKEEAEAAATTAAEE